jgi:ParB family transcriptional regulator, chromosome partitioning protein
MSKRTQRLGRGLEALIGTEDFQPMQHSPPAKVPAPQPVPATPAGPAVQSIPLGAIEPNPFQPRQQFDDAGLAELAQSIKSDGILQPITLRKAGDRYQLIAGERRWRAAGLAGMTEVPAILRQANDNEMLVLALVENIQREDLNAIEKAQAYEALRKTTDLPIEQLARRLGQDRSTVSNYLRLLELDEFIQTLIRSRQVSMGHARALLGAPEEHRIRLARQTVDQDLSVRAIERQVQLLRAGKPVAKAAETRPHVRQLEERFTQSLGAKAKIKEGPKGKSGRIVIYYRTLDDFDRICDRLNVDIESL